jgi:Ca2+-binding RTX toxin-like protein
MSKLYAKTTYIEGNTMSYVTIPSDPSSMKSSDLEQFSSLLTSSFSTALEDNYAENSPHEELPTSNGKTLVSLLDKHLGIVDTGTGELEFINANISLTDIALNDDDKLFGSTFRALYEIDLEDGSFVKIGDFGANINGLGFSSDRQLYATGNSGFYSVDTNTGSATLVANLESSFFSSGDLIFDENTDRFWVTSRGISNDNLFEVSLDGTSRLVGPIGFKDVFGLASDEQGNLLGYTAQGEQISIDKSTGEGTFLVSVSPLIGTIGGATNYNHANVLPTLQGTDGRDTLIGTEGDDTIIGLGGSDDITGNGGSDKFVFQSLDDRIDRIRDFAVGEDQIVLTELFSSLGVAVSSYDQAIAEGYLELTSFGQDDSRLRIDPDGAVGRSVGRTLAIIYDVAATDLGSAINWAI